MKLDKVLNGWMELYFRKRKSVQTSRVKEIYGRISEVKEMQSFILEQLRGEVVDVYCGGPDVFSGRVESCANNVLTIEQNDKYTYIAVDKIIAIWRAQYP